MSSEPCWSLSLLLLAPRDMQSSRTLRGGGVWADPALKPSPLSSSQIWPWKPLSPVPCPWVRTGEERRGKQESGTHPRSQDGQILHPYPGAKLHIQDTLAGMQQVGCPCWGRRGLHTEMPAKPDSITTSHWLPPVCEEEVRLGWADRTGSPERQRIARTCIHSCAMPVVRRTGGGDYLQEQRPSRAMGPWGV